ncbi:hypothetical protein [Gordonia jacobaea]|uniref:hypothetical protein n=1 Tax=Gordonia jacobaea TaxID=122202 RepID=UPI003D716B74
MGSPAAVGVLAQALAVSAGFLPLFFNMGSVVAFVLVASAISNLLVGSATLAVAYRLPVLGNSSGSNSAMSGSRLGFPWKASRDSTAALVALGIFVGGCLAVGAVLVVCEVSFGTVVMCGGVILLGQGIFQITQTVAVTFDSYVVAMRMRLIYGFSTFILSLLCCVLALNAIWFAFSVSAGYAVAALVGLCSLHAGPVWLESVRRFQPSYFIKYAIEGRTLFFGQLINGVALQAGAIATASMGSLAAAWAVSCRVSGGLQTTAGQIVAPAIDARVARHMRSGDVHSVARSVRLGSLIGLILVFACGFVTLGILTYFNLTPSASDSAVVFWIAVIGFNCLQIVCMPIDRVLAFMGGARLRLLWACVRLLGVVFALVMNDLEAFLVVLGVTGLIGTSMYCIGTVFYMKTWASTFRRSDVNAKRSADLGIA